MSNNMDLGHSNSLTEKALDVVYLSGPDSEKDLCPGCDGTGKANNNSCWRCNGEGIIYES